MSDKARAVRPEYRIDLRIVLCGEDTTDGVGWQATCLELGVIGLGATMGEALGELAGEIGHRVILAMKYPRAGCLFNSAGAISWSRFAAGETVEIDTHWLMRLSPWFTGVEIRRFAGEKD